MVGVRAFSRILVLVVIVVGSGSIAVAVLGWMVRAPVAFGRLEPAVKRF